MKHLLLTNLGVFALGLGLPSIFIWSESLRPIAFILACIGFVLVVVSLFIMRYKYAKIINNTSQSRLGVEHYEHALFDTLEGVVRIRCSKSGNTHEVKIQCPNTFLIQCPGCGVKLPEAPEKQKWCKASIM